MRLHTTKERFSSFILHPSSFIVRWFIFVIMVLLVVGCQADEGGDTAVPDTGMDSFRQSVPVRPDYGGPQPEPGTGNLFGVFLWNGRSAAGLDVLLCPDFSSFSGCGGREFTVKTGPDGDYLFANIEPGAYALSVRVFDSDDWLYITGGILSSADFVVEEGETLVVDTYNIFKLDVTPTNPINQGKVVAGEELILTWQPYESAAYYEIYLTPDNGDAILVSERADTNEIRADLLPVNCDYRWTVDAFNSNGIKIAETAGFYQFRAGGGAGSCYLQINTPLDGAQISGDGIILDWEPHLMAASYKILMWNDDDPDKSKVLDFVVVPEARYTFTAPLDPARYVWSVDAYDADGQKIASSEIFDFTVVP